MNLTYLLMIICDNRDAMIRKYPENTKLIIDVHNNMMLLIDELLKSKP